LNWPNAADETDSDSAQRERTTPLCLKYLEIHKKKHIQSRQDGKHRTMKIDLRIDKVAQNKFQLV